MNLIDLFNSDELELPGSWQSYSGTFDQYIDVRFAAYLDAFRQLSSSDYLSDTICREYGTAVQICDSLKRCVKAYLDGHPPRAYTELANALTIARRHLDAMQSVDDISGAITHLYRVRVAPAPLSSARELFHLPFELRHKAATFRYSIPGLPCLYLGGSLYVCWQELGRPAIGQMNVARFQPAVGKTFKVLDFGWRPALFAALLHKKSSAPDLHRPSRLSDLITANAVCWPILAACSMKVKISDAPFKPEYIVSQLLLQWLTMETKLDGLRYFSTRVDEYLNDPTPQANFIFPVRSNKPAGYCDDLVSRFEVTSPLFWPTVCSTPLPAPPANYMNFKINWPPGTLTKTPYVRTDLGKLQIHAANRACNKI